MTEHEVNIKCPYCGRIVIESIKITTNPTVISWDDDTEKYIIEDKKKGGA